jgi:hypothetical protein
MTSVGTTNTVFYFYCTLTAFSGTKAERLTLLNGVRASERAKRFYMLPAKPREDIDFELVDIDEVKLGDAFNITVNINVSSCRPMSIVLHITGRGNPYRY